MAASAADVRDIQRFADNIGRVPDAVQDAIRARIAKSAQALIKLARRAVPLSDEAPHLRESIRAEDGDQRAFEVIVRVGNDHLLYAMALEFGHRGRDGNHVPANPFWRPVRRVVSKQHRNGMRRDLRKALKLAFPDA